MDRSQSIGIVTRTAEKALRAWKRINTGYCCGSMKEYLGNSPAAQSDAERVIDTNPNLSWGDHFLAGALNMKGRLQEAIAAAQKAIRLDPALQDHYGFQVGWANLLMAQYKTAVHYFERVRPTIPY